MAESLDTRITRTIIDAYHEKVLRALVSDAIVVGAGPAGLMAAIDLARKGRTVTLLEKRLTPGGGIWGGAMEMNEVVIEEEALPVLSGIPVRSRARVGGLSSLDATELASALSLEAARVGAVLLTLTIAEDLCVRGGQVCGVVANRTGVPEQYPVDPISFEAGAVLDATGHDAALVHMLGDRGLLPNPSGLASEGPMHAAEGEAFVVENVSEVFPGLWIAGMSVQAVMGGARMGPIFGGMLRSGRRAAELMDMALALEERGS